jgi:hypothetical protein
MKGRPMVDGSGEHKSALKAFWNKKKKAEEQKNKSAGELVSDRSESKDKQQELIDKQALRDSKKGKVLFGNIKRKRNAKKLAKEKAKQAAIQAQINVNPEAQSWRGKKTSPKSNVVPKGTTEKQIKQKTVRTKKDKWDLVNWVQGKEGLIPDKYGKSTKQSIKDATKKVGRGLFTVPRVIGKGIDWVNRKLSHDQND